MQLNRLSLSLLRKVIDVQLIRIRTDDELMWYKNMWDDILANEGNDNPFIEFVWFYNWWQTMGRREHVELYAVENDGQIIAFFSIYDSTSLGNTNLCICRRK